MPSKNRDSDFTSFWQPIPSPNIPPKLMVRYAGVVSFRRLGLLFVKLFVKGGDSAAKSGEKPSL